MSLLPLLSSQATGKGPKESRQAWGDGKQSCGQCKFRLTKSRADPSDIKAVLW